MPKTAGTQSVCKKEANEPIREERERKTPAEDCIACMIQPLCLWIQGFFCIIGKFFELPYYTKSSPGDAHSRAWKMLPFGNRA
ncbi:MAG: hypothetical protein OSJ52_09620, partial [Lachnospiraceae bacterium]|nr:hypothetical protein [Lachnospiraceae bacterium]